MVLFLKFLKMNKHFRKDIFSKLLDITALTEMFFKIFFEIIFTDENLTFFFPTIDGCLLSNNYKTHSQKLHGQQKT